MRWVSGIAQVVIGACLVIGPAAFAADPPPAEILERALELHDEVEDYTVQTRVVTDLPGFDMPERSFTVYVKRPDKVKIESTSLVVLPRDVLLLGNLKKHMTEAGQVITVGVRRDGPRPVYCLKFMPANMARRHRLLLWVTGERWTLTRSEVWAGMNRLLTVYWQYVKVNDRFWMPAEVKCEISGGILGREGPGTVTVTFTDYEINTGLSDELFDGEEP